MNKRHEAPDDRVYDLLAQLDKDVCRIQTAMICSFAVLFYAGFALLIC